jgi:hypothetical protein
MLTAQKNAESLLVSSKNQYTTCVPCWLLGSSNSKFLEYTRSLNAKNITHLRFRLR